MKSIRIAIVCLTVGLIFALGGCASENGASSGGDSGTSSDTSSASTIPPGAAAVPASSPLARVEIGMSQTKVRGILGDPNDDRSYPTGKNWIPFYFGGDTFRTEWLYPGVGKVIFGNTSRFSQTMKVVDLLHDPAQQ